VFKNKLRQLLRDRMRRIKISYEEPYKVGTSRSLSLSLAQGSDTVSVLQHDRR
jgi:hypothetical protein